MNEENSPGVSAPDILTAGAKHMSDRAALRDSPSGERSMKRCVEAFNALEGTALSETQGWRFMAVLKHARATQGSLSMDDYEDWAAYAALAGESAARETTAGDPTTEKGIRKLGTVDVKQATEGIKSCIAALSSFNPAPEPEAFTVIRQGTQTGLKVTDKAAVEFSMNNPPLIGQEYYYLSNTGVLASRRWQSTPQEWKRLHKGQVFKSGDACREKDYQTPYISHEDDPVSYPEIGKEFWYVEVNPVFGEWQAYYFKVKREESLRVAEALHRLGQAASGKEQAEAKALWRNLSMQRHGTPYGPLHPDAKQYDEPLSGSDEGEEHD